MSEKILVGFIGAVLALLIRELVERCRRKSNSKKLANVCLQHLEQIQTDLNQHVSVSDGRATFDETQYCEVVVGDFLYDLITSNINLFPSAESLKKTTMFFHHYKINMATVRVRLDSSTNGATYLTERTYNNLLNSLGEAINELQSIVGT